MVTCSEINNDPDLECADSVKVASERDEDREHLFVKLPGIAEVLEVDVDEDVGMVTGSETNDDPDLVCAYPVKVVSRRDEDKEYLENLRRLLLKSQRWHDNHVG